MKAKVTKAFMGVPDGSIYPIQFNPGDEVEGDLAREVIAAGWAAPENKAEAKAPRTKAKE